MPKITEAQKESRRRQILDAALRCFSRDGFHATTTADIVRESGVSQGTLYLYFATKEDLIVALADDRHQAEAMVNALAESEEDPAKGVALLLEIYGGSLADPMRSEMRRVGVQGWAEALRNDAIHASVTSGLTAVRREIMRLVARGQKRGQFRADADPEAVARLLIAVFQGLILQTTFGETIDLSAIGRVMERMLLGALYAETAPAAEPSEERP
jgi:AcrR family transcriptional regulator